MAALHLVVKALEKVLCHAFGRTVDEPLAQLRDLAAHRGMHGVVQLAAFLPSGIRGQRHQFDLRVALAKTSDSA
ncbi:hypothetical protein D3C72_1459170 [compost metagenome]